MKRHTDNTKRIKITSKGMVTTSRGRCRTPIGTPYKESCNVILNMLSKDNATIIEVMDDGTEVKLDIFNFSADNSKSHHVTEVATKKEESSQRVISDVSPQPVVETNRKLTRKERRALEQQERKAAMEDTAATTTEDDVVEAETPVDEPVVEEVTEAPVEVTEDAVTE